MTIFRYQDDEGRGPFRPGMTERWLVDHESKPVGLINERGIDRVRHHVAAFSAMHPGVDFHYGFGCASLNGLFRWFTSEERQKIAALGYHLVAMIADRAVCGNRSEILFARRRPLNQRAVILTIE